MKRLIYWLCLCSLLSTTALAQSSGRNPLPVPSSSPSSLPPPSSSIPTAPAIERIVRPSSSLDRSAGQPRDAVFTATAPYCLQTGDILLVSGKNFSSLQHLTGYLQIGSTAVELQLLNSRDHQLAFKIPKKDVRAGQVYQLRLEAEGRAVLNTGLKVRTCEQFAIDQFDQNQELLIFGPVEFRGAVLTELAINAATVTEQFSLNGFGQFLLLVQTDIAAELTEELEQKFSEIAVDLNTDLSASGFKPRIYAPKLLGWNEGNDCRGPFTKTKIGLIDGAIDEKHAAFDAAKIVSKDFVETSALNYTHGTAIASMWVGNAPDMGINGLLKEATLFNAIVLRQTQNGKARASVKAVVRGLDWMFLNDVRLIGVSLATTRPNKVLQKIVEISLSKGLLIFAAAGNFGPTSKPAYPAAMEGVFAVTAIDSFSRSYVGANAGDYIDFSAPGVDVWLAAEGDGGGYYTGTSFAAPYALAVAALYLKKNHNLSRSVLSKILTQTAKQLGDPTQKHIFGAGLLQAKC